MFGLTNPIFQSADKAREYLESLHWPNGPVCPHCGEEERVTRLTSKTARRGLVKCNACRKQFTVTVGTVMEDSKIPLNKWLLAFRLLNGGKKGFSAHELHRALGVTYKSAWFLLHRIRETMDSGNDPLGGPGAIVEADETWVGGKARNRAYGKPAPKKIVMALVERDGHARSFHVANVHARTLRSVLVTNVDRMTNLASDGLPAYVNTGFEFRTHGTVNHGAGEYARTETRPGFWADVSGRWHTNSVENFFSIFKRGVIGTYHHMSEAHIHRYCREFDFRYNTRHLSDAERTAEAIKGARGKRLMYRQPSSLAA
jgi:transposase-like protein